MDRPGAWLLPGLLAGVMGGIGLADAGWLGLGLASFVILGACGIALTALFLPARSMAVGAVAVACLLGVILGGIRGSAAPTVGPGDVAALQPGATVRVTGVVADDPVPRGTTEDVVLDVITADGSPRDGQLLVGVPRSVVVRAGDEVAVEVQLRGPPLNANEAAYRERLRRQGVGALGRAYEVSVLGHRSNPVGEVFAGLREWLLNGLVTTVPEPEASLAAGILLGVRAGIDPAIRDAFAIAGLSHVVAISGWNVAIVVVLLGGLTKPLRRRAGPVVPAVLALAAVAGYVVLVGASPAVVRAALMAAALVLARLAGSPAHAASALMGAVLAMLLVTPSALWDVGFQLSALATGGLIVLGAPIEGRLERWPAWIRTPVALTVAAQLATLPVLLATFGQVSLVAPLANVAVVPLIPAVMAGAALASLVGGLAILAPVPLLADVATWLSGGVAWLPLRGLIAVGTGAAQLPLAAVPMAGSPILTAAWYPILAMLARRWHRRPPPETPSAVAVSPDTPARDHASPALPEAAAFAAAAAWLARPQRAALALAAILVLATVLTRPDGRLHLTVLDIGQGDAILIEAPDGSVGLIDGGPDPDRTLREIGEALPFWQRTIDLVQLTHPHLDHLGGLVEVLRRYHVRAYVDGGRPTETGPLRQLRAAAVAEPGIRIQNAVAGQVIPLGGAELEILFPTPTDVARPPPMDDVNNTSVVVLLRYGGFRALLAGDAEAPVEQLLADRGALSGVDVLKVGHHGSNSGTTPAFLAAIGPSVAIISVGQDNDYGHPHRSTLDHLAAVPGLALFRTDLDGTVEVETDGWTYGVHTDRDTGTGPLRVRAPRGAGTGTIAAWPCPTATTLMAPSCWPTATMATGSTGPWPSTRNGRGRPIGSSSPRNGRRMRRSSSGQRSRRHRSGCSDRIASSCASRCARPARPRPPPSVWWRWSSSFRRARSWPWPSSGLPGTSRVRRPS